MPEPASVLVLDTSVWINLLATGCWQEIISSLGCACIAPEQVANEIKRDPITGQPYDPPGQPLFGSTPIEVLSAEEQATFLSLVSASLGDRLGDGEASAIAIAVHRGFVLVVDERKARRICTDRWPGLRLMRSSELLRSRPVLDSLGQAKASECFERARSIARMHV